MGKSKKPFFHKLRGMNITKLMKRDGSNCSICKQPLDRHIKDVQHIMYITFDHIIPRSQGGNDLLENLRLAHYLCNQLRGTDPVLDEAA